MMDREYIIKRLFDDESYMGQTEQSVYDFINDLELNFEWEEIETLLDRSIDERFRKLASPKGTEGLRFFEALTGELRSLSWPIRFGTLGILVRCMNESSLTKEYYLPYLIAALEQILFRQLFTYSMKRYTVGRTIEDCYLSDLAGIVKGDPENVVHRAVRRVVTAYDHIVFLLTKLSGRRAVYVPYIRPAIGLIVLIAILCLYYFDYLNELGDEGDDDGGDKKHHHHKRHHWHHHNPHRPMPPKFPIPPKPKFKHRFFRRKFSDN